eukprot:gb/GFBE01020798.1/.p1 GENE.gb/GFBE01020798.1/~~gb/GFBE01020798.1/.p1  ORF type:complete len:268 (+),score=21.33 gb/GFBE01020798.1/:1-804(+)
MSELASAAAALPPGIESAPFAEKRSNAQRNRARAYKRWFFRGLNCSRGPPGLDQPPDALQSTSIQHDWADLEDTSLCWSLRPEHVETSVSVALGDTSQSHSHLQATADSDADETDREWAEMQDILRFISALQRQHLQQDGTTSVDNALDMVHASHFGIGGPVQQEAFELPLNGKLEFPGLSFLTYRDAGCVSAVSVRHAALIYSGIIAEDLSQTTDDVEGDGQNFLTSTECQRLDRAIVSLAGQEQLCGPALRKLKAFWTRHPWYIP